VGGQDELVFDGHGMVLDDQGRLLMRGRSFEEELILYDLSLGEGYKKALPRAGKMLSHRITTSPRQRGSVISIPFDLGTSKKSPFSISKGEKVALPHSVGEVYRALVLGTRDYVEKNGFSEVVIGVSGGVDSALTATIAVDALGPKRVVGVFLPSEFTSRASQEDVASLVKGLGIRLIHLSIQDLFQAYLSLLKGPFQGCPRDITEENIQARIRGNLLMALSNKFGWLVLTTGNKSEMSVGYATLYGDMAGGFAVLKDVPKMLVYRLARYRNRTLGEVIPRRTLKREPTAELRPGQRDADSIPP
jgi:NAD+ synthase (glutamine-hydrolysing)